MTNLIRSITFFSIAFGVVLFVSAAIAQDPLAPIEEPDVLNKEETQADLKPKAKDSQTTPNSDTSLTENEIGIFLGHVSNRDIDALIESMAPALQQLIDRPVLELLVAAINKNLGKVESINIKASNSTVPASNVNGVKELVAIVKFERGEAETKLTVQNKKLIAFNISSDKIVKWLDRPKDLTVYDKGCQQFVRLFMAGKRDDAYNLLHPELKKVVSPEQMQQMIDKVRNASGELSEIRLFGDRFKFVDGIPTLHLDYVMKCKSKQTGCEIKIQFIGMRGEILGFQFK